MSATSHLYSANETLRGQATNTSVLSLHRARWSVCVYATRRKLLTQELRSRLAIYGKHKVEVVKLIVTVGGTVRRCIGRKKICIYARSTDSRGERCEGLRPTLILLRANSDRGGGHVVLS